MKLKVAVLLSSVSGVLLASPVEAASIYLNNSASASSFGQSGAAFETAVAFPIEINTLEETETSATRTLQAQAGLSFAESFGSIDAETGVARLRVETSKDPFANSSSADAEASIRLEETITVSGRGFSVRYCRTAEIGIFLILRTKALAGELRDQLL